MTGKGKSRLRKATKALTGALACVWSEAHNAVDNLRPERTEQAAGKTEGPDQGGRGGLWATDKTVRKEFCRRRIARD